MTSRSVPSSGPPEAPVVDELRERVKELTCLYEVAAVFAERRGSLEERLAHVVNVLPLACRYPERVVARLRLDEIDVVSHGASLDPSAPQLRAPLRVAGAERGEVILGWVADRGADRSADPQAASGTRARFLPEERPLLDSVAGQIGVFVAGVEAERRRAEMEASLRHMDRLATIGQLAAGVAHELNEPLGNALGFAQLALKAPDVPAQVAADLRRIAEAALRGREIIRKLLVFARQAPASKRRVQLNAVIEEAMFLLEAGCENPGVRFVCDLGADLPEIEADAVQLRQVVTNLVINAMQSIGAGGTVTVRTRADDGAVVLFVEDTGCGISPAILGRIFDPFFTTKNVGQGTGLGLSVVQGIVAGHGGSIDVDSAPRRGSVFRVRLPVDAAPPA